LLVEGRSIFAARFPAPVSCISNSYAKTKKKAFAAGDGFASASYDRFGCAWFKRAEYLLISYSENISKYRNGTWLKSCG